MPLFQADIHLHRARLFGPQCGGPGQPPYPWASASHDLREARRLIDKHGYGRRLEEFRLPYPGWVQCMDGLARHYSLTGGFSGFWDASYLTHLSREHLKVLELTGDLQPSAYFDNPNWYTGAKRTKASRQAFQFILADDFDPGKVLERFGPPQSQEQCGAGKRVFIYRSLEPGSPVRR